MGLVGFLKFAAKCFDILAWPLFALGYPLCSSIRAIESNSNSDIQKLVTYWVLFSLISLFDHAFVKLLEWLPFWPYVRLMVICWLIIPQFDGAFYVYEHLVRPCFSANPQVFINWFNKPKEEFFLKSENFLVVAERYVKENGSEALEKLIASKIQKIGGRKRKDEEEEEEEEEEVEATLRSGKEASSSSQRTRRRRSHRGKGVEQVSKPDLDVKEQIKEVTATEKKEVAAINDIP